MSKVTFILLCILPALAMAGPTKVGNGDDGADLEKLQKVESGILVSTRDKALEQLRALNVRSVKGLGTLEQELKQAAMYVVQGDVASPKKFDKGMETSADGKWVYARTIAQPHSPVRFFPASLSLDEEQLVKLHIHEALHRALPESIREDESVVSEITLALTSPGANRDSVEVVMGRSLSSPQMANHPMVPPLVGVSVYQPTERLKTPSTLRYGYQVFNIKKDEKDLYPLVGMHRVDNFLHPFGGPTDSLGMGLSFSFLKMEDRSYMGPLQISGRQLLSTWRAFDVEAYGEYSMYTLSNEELKNLPQARDAMTLGVSIKRDADYFYTENFLSAVLPSAKEFKIGGVRYRQDYSSIVTAKVGAGGKYKGFSGGLNLELSLTDGSEVFSASGSFLKEKERIRLVKFGPEVGYASGGFKAALFAKSVIDGTPGYTISDMGDLLGHGAGQSFAGSSLEYRF